MRLLVSFNMFKPLLRDASKMTTPIQELKIAGGGRAESIVGDIAEFTTKSTGLDGVCRKLFTSFEEFKASALARLNEYRAGVPENLYTEIEKSTSNNEFELTKAITKYYSKLNDCKTLEEVAAIYPEFAHLNVDMANELRTLIKSSIPENICKEAMKFSTKEERLNYIIKYMDQVTNKCVKEWQSYPDIVRIQRETAVEIANGQYSGCADARAGLKFFANKEPLRFYLLDKKDRDNVILSYLKQYYLEGKSIQNIVPETVAGRVMTPGIMNYKNGFHFVNSDYINLRSVAATIEKEAGEFKAISQLSKGEINSAIIKRVWTKSGLKKDMALETQYGKGWTNVKNILLKRKGKENYISSSDDMINRYLLMRYKTNNRSTVEKNPFLKCENPETDKTSRVKYFVNNMYHVSEITMNDRIILKSPEFKKFKAEFDIEGMKESIRKIEDQYINIFFKRFWTDIRIERFTSALQEASVTARENIQINDAILMQALKDTVV